MVIAGIVKFLHYILVGGLCGLCSGLIITVLEILTLQSSDLSAGLVGVSAGAILPAAMLSGMILGLLLAILNQITALLGRLWGPLDGALGGALVVGASSIPAMSMLAATLARGRKAAALLGPWHMQLLVTLAGALLCGLCVWFGMALARRIERAQSLIGALASALSLLGLTAVLFWADANLYPRLYQYLHGLLLMMYFITAALAALSIFHLLSRSSRGNALRSRRRSMLLGAVALAIVLADGWHSRRTLKQDPQLRYAACELTVVTQKLHGYFPLPKESGPPPFLKTMLPRQARHTSSLRIPDANVILVSIDALRPDHLGVYGYHRPTSPNLDALAARSVRFANAYCQVPLTCFSVPSMHTGDYVRSTLPLLPKPPPTLARILSGRGYTTAAFYNSSLFFCDDQLAQSYGTRRFDFDYTETELREATPLTTQVIRYIHDFSRSGGRKLFLWVHYFDVHEPYRELPEHNFGKDAVDRYDGEIANVDQALGRLFGALSQLHGPTIFILTADHGEEFNEHGGYNHGSSLYDEQIKVPLIIGGPGIKPGVVRSPAQVVDIVPTVLSLLGARVPETVRGRPLLDSLSGQARPHRPAYAEVHTKKMVRLGDWKLIHDYRRGTDELYHLKEDPGEKTNLIGSRPRATKRLRAMLNRWFDQISSIAQKREMDRPEAIDLGRIGDRRAFPLLSRLMLDHQQKSKWRQEAARLLGQLQDSSAAEALWMAVADDDRLVAQEAAVALGEIKDKRARLVLPTLMSSTHNDLRLRGAVALARVDGAEAIPALIEALYGDDWELQTRAAHYLGYVGDRRAIDPLLQVASTLHMRARAIRALGLIGRRIKDNRIYTYLLDRALHDSHGEVQRHALAGLGSLGDRRAIRPLGQLLLQQPELIGIPAALQALGGIGSYWTPGLNLGPRRRGLKKGWGKCLRSTSVVRDNRQQDTWCFMTAPTANVALEVKRRPYAAQLMLKVRLESNDLQGRALGLVINGQRFSPQKLTGQWQTLKFGTKARHWRKGWNNVQLRFESPPRSGNTAGNNLIAVDFLLITPLARSDT